MTKIEKLWKFMKEKKIDKGWTYSSGCIDRDWSEDESDTEYYMWYINIIEEEEEVLVSAEFGSPAYNLIDERFIRNHVEDINTYLKTSYAVEELLNKIDGSISADLDFWHNLYGFYNDLRDKEEYMWYSYRKPLISSIQEPSVSFYTDLGYININYFISKVIGNLKRYISELTELLEKENETIDKDVIYKNIKDNSTKLGIKENKSGGFSIYPMDNKDISIIRFEKLDENKEEYKFIVEIKDRDKFEYETTIKAKEDLNKAIDFVIESFNSHPIFSKYMDDIEELKI